MTVFSSLWALIIGYTLDLAFGDPHGFPHIVRVCGRLIAMCEKKLKPNLPDVRVACSPPEAQRRFGEQRARTERIAGGKLVLAVTAVCTLAPWAAGAALYRLSFWAGLAAESFICYQLLATRALRDESLAVYVQLQKGDLPAARRAVSMIVGRDTAQLDATGVTRAAVETVAENAGDAVVAPLFWIGLLGTAGGCFCKAVNTMDSMIGYKNENYRHFGTCAAKLDDAVNFIPARLAGLLSVAAAALCRFDATGAWRIFCRDRRKHESPNSAHTEAAFAGALGVQLAGPASYEGRPMQKPYLGDALRPVEIEDIRRAHRLLYAVSALALALSAALRCALLCIQD